jgi:hypothetical protein
LRHFDDLMTREHDRHQGHNNNNYDEQVNDNWDEYSADSELDDQDARHPVQHIHAWQGWPSMTRGTPLMNSLILLLFGGWNMARNILMTYHKLDCFKAGDAG